MGTTSNAGCALGPPSALAVVEVPFVVTKEVLMVVFTVVWLVMGIDTRGDGDSGGVAGKELKLTTPDWEEQMRRLHERME